MTRLPGAPTTHKVQTSPYLSIVHLGETAAIADGIRGIRHIVPAGIARALSRLRDTGTWEEALASDVSNVDHTRWRRFLLVHGYLQIANSRIDGGLAALLRSIPAVQLPRQDNPSPPIRVLYLSHCGVERLARQFGKAAYLRGFSVAISHSLYRDIELIGETRADLVIVEPFNVDMAARFWGGGVLAGDAERSALISMLTKYYESVIRDLVPRSMGRLILVRGIGTPLLRPDGRAEFRRNITLVEMARTVNAHVRRLVAHEANIVFIDDHAIASAGKYMEAMQGASNYANLAGIGFDLTSETDSFMLCEEYIDAYVMWRGIGSLKCVVVDLDNTLWPGVVGEGGGLADIDEAMRFEVGQGLFGGIHQALSILQRRGILLATCSQNNRAEVLNRWSALNIKPASEPFLLPEHFALHEIGWDPKPKAMERILSSLSLHPSHVLFIDDEAAHRETMKDAFPEMSIAGDSLWSLRIMLLTDPRLQVNIVTEAAGARTTSTKASLIRRAATEGKSDAATLLRGLDIKLQVTRVARKERLARVAELLQRTNQFNLTGFRPDIRALQQLLDSPGGALFILEVQDRFGNYGLVGVCLMRGNYIENVAISCRVIGLAVAVPFLVAVFRDFAYLHEVLSGRVVLTDRNIPCRHLLRDLGFAEIQPLEFHRAVGAPCPSIDASTYELVMLDERNSAPSAVEPYDSNHHAGTSAALPS